MFQILGKIAEAAIAGLVSGLCMTLFETPFWKKYGMGVVAEWQVNAAMVSMISRKKAAGNKSRTHLAVAMHLVHGIVLGVIFFFISLYVLKLNQLLSMTLAAILYSILLWAITPYATKSAFESIGNFKITTQGLAVSFGSHIIYGVILGLLVVQFV